MDRSQHVGDKGRATPGAVAAPSVHAITYKPVFMTRAQVLVPRSVCL
jgi:hypothetical protein